MNWYLEVLKKYAVFTGRARREEYWMFVLFNVIITFVLGFLEELVGDPGIIGMIYGLAILIPGIAVSVRRLHDTDRSGWWLLIAFVPLAGAIVLLVFMATDGTTGDNQFGSNPKTTIALNENRKYRNLCFSLAGLIALFIFSIVIISLIEEAEAVLSEGLSVFISDTLGRFFFGLAIACFTGLPYFLGAIAVSKMKYPLFMFLTCLGLFIFDMYLIIQFLFFSTGSTSSIAILFLPPLFAAPVLIVWGIVSLVSKHSNDEES